MQRLTRWIDSAGDVAAGTIRLADLAYTLNKRPDDLGRRRLVPAGPGGQLDPDHAGQKLDRAAKKLATAAEPPIRDVSGIYFATEPLGARWWQLAFLFPGEGSQYPSMLADLCLHFP